MNGDRQNSEYRYGVPEYLPVDDLDPGTNVVVSGPTAAGARGVALSLLTGGGDAEGLLLVSADVDGESLLAHCDDVVGALDRERVAVVDCSGVSDDQRRFDAGVVPIEGPGDLGAIGIESSRLYESLAEREYDGIRIGVVSVSSMLLDAPLPEVSRYVHTLTGRIVATGDLGVYLVDSAAGDPRAVETLERFCDRRVTVRRENDGRPAVRVDDIGRAGDMGEWTAFDPPWSLETGE
jgi:hypothetical protein